MKAYFFIISSGNSTTSYANTLLALELKNLGYNIDIVKDNDRKKSILNNPDCDAIFFQKTIQCPLHTHKYISHLKNKVHLIHIDNDFQDMGSKEKIKTLKLSDLVIVCTNKHKKALRSFTSSPIEVVSCMIDSQNYSYVSIDEKHNNPLIISWQQDCADAYTKDLLMIATPLNKLHELYKIQLNLYGWHMGKDYRDLRHKIDKIIPFATFIPHKPLNEYLTELVPKIANSDIIIMPYIDHPGRWGKSAFGLKRLMLLGLPAVVSDTEHNRTLITNGENGFLASTPEQWYNSLESLILDKSLRQKFSINSKQIIDTKYSNSIIIKQFIASVNKHINLF
ncbi:MAG: glycosyltransferase [Vallitalea sp.]|jgi:glycosyltransferase involved in cell wall biosynthesis|nr:glycosyltransferase [Vallitalea sp.]